MGMRMKSTPIFKAALFLSAVLVLAWSTASAQSVPNDIGVSLSASSDSPIPGQSVTITAESYTADLNASNIIWTVGGREYARGVGQKNITVTAPGAGKTLTIRVTAVTQDGVQMTSSMTIGSGDVDLIVESSGYTPPFFKGKVPLSYQNTFTIVAVPHIYNSSGKAYDPKTLIYEWRRDWKALPDQSGYGKQALTLKGDIVPRPYTISVVVSTRDGSARAERMIPITPGKPSLGFYIDDPLYGTLYNKAVTDRINLGKEREATILAVPFGFTVTQGDTEDMRFDWAVNGASRTNLSSGRSVTLRAPSDAGGMALISLSVRGVGDILQGADKSIYAAFEAPKKDAEEETFTSF